MDGVHVVQLIYYCSGSDNATRRSNGKDGDDDATTMEV